MFFVNSTMQIYVLTLQLPNNLLNIFSIFL